MYSSRSVADCTGSTAPGPPLLQLPPLAGERDGARNGPRTRAVLTHCTTGQPDCFGCIREGKLMSVLPAAKINIGHLPLLFQGHFQQAV